MRGLTGQATAPIKGYNRQGLREKKEREVRRAEVDLFDQLLIGKSIINWLFKGKEKDLLRKDNQLDLLLNQSVIGFYQLLIDK